MASDLHLDSYRRNEAPELLAPELRVANAVDLHLPDWDRQVACGVTTVLVNPPDFDVVAYVGAILWYGFDKDKAFENVWQVVHHRYTHGLAFVLVTAIVADGLMRFSASERKRGGRADI